MRIHYLLLIPSNVLGITNAFICYKFIVFKTVVNILREYFRCYIVYGCVVFASSVITFVLMEWLGIAPTVSNCASVLVTTVISCLGHREFSYLSGGRIMSGVEGIELCNRCVKI